jgi:DNA-binding Lrp family transcriptional regulator
MKQLISTLYRDGTLYYDPETLADRIGLRDADAIQTSLERLGSRIQSPFTVIDPRYLGYSFPSYTFVETKNNLETGAEARETHFRNPRHTMLIGTVLGDVDLIQRRVDENRWANGEFAKWANERLDYFEKFETYPIFQIARWHGQDRSEALVEPPRDLSETERTVLQSLREEPRILQRLRSADASLESTDLPSSLEDYDVSGVKDVVERLLEEEIILGASVSHDLFNSPWKCALMGLTLGSEDEGDSSDGPRMELTTNHDAVIEKLQTLETELVDNFTMPFISSGVGQNWADVVIELRVEDSHDLDQIAETVRAIDHVETTKTYLMTNSCYNTPIGTVA